MDRTLRSPAFLSLAALALIASCALAARANARMTVIYDVPDSVQTLLNQGLNVGDGLYQQQPVAAILPGDRQVEKVTGGTGTAATPSLVGLGANAIASLLRARIDSAGARMVFVDTGPNIPYETVVNLNSAMGTLKSTSYPSGGRYADRVHMYVRPDRLFADSGSFWQAIARSGGGWFETYGSGTVRWTDMQWSSSPQRIRDGLVARGMSKSRLHLMVRGADQGAVWAKLRTGVACEFLRNGPGAYRIEDHAGFVNGFRSAFGTAPAPSGPSEVSCTG